MIQHDLKKIGSTVSKYSANFNRFPILSLEFGGKSQTIGGVWTPGTLVFWMYDHVLLLVLGQKLPFFEVVNRPGNPLYFLCQVQELMVTALSITYSPSDGLTLVGLMQEKSTDFLGHLQGANAI